MENDRNKKYNNKNREECFQQLSTAKKSKQDPKNCSHVEKAGWNTPPTI